MTSHLNLGTLLRLLLACMVVGAAMAFLHITPAEIAHYLSGFTSDLVRNAATWARTVVSYVLLGAVIVIPIWLLSLLFRSTRGSR